MPLKSKRAVIIGGNGSMGPALNMLMSSAGPLNWNGKINAKTLTLTQGANRQL